MFIDRNKRYWSLITFSATAKANVYDAENDLRPRSNDNRLVYIFKYTIFFFF